MKSKYSFPIRINSYIAKASILSRRAAEEAVREGRVEVNNLIIMDLSYKVQKSDTVSLDGVILSLYPRSVVYMLNKPRGCICSTSDPHCQHYARDFIKTRDHDMLICVGRLDKDSEGLLLFTTDGNLANKIIHPSQKIKKKYIVNTVQKIKVNDLIKMKKGIEFEDSKTPYAIYDFVVISSHYTEIMLIDGKNRQIRRLFEYYGYEIKSLCRISIGTLEMDDLKSGSYKKLSQEDIEKIFL